MNATSATSAASYLLSILSNTLQAANSTASTTNPTRAAATPTTVQSPDTSQLSPFAQLMKTLQQLQQSDPAQYKQVTQQIATNLAAAAQQRNSRSFRRPSPRPRRRVNSRISTTPIKRRRAAITIIIISKERIPNPIVVRLRPPVRQPRAVRLRAVRLRAVQLRALRLPAVRLRALLPRQSPPLQARPRARRANCWIKFCRPINPRVLSLNLSPTARLLLSRSRFRAPSAKALSANWLRRPQQ